MLKEDINLLPPPILMQRMHRLYGIRARHLYWKVMMSIVLVAVAYGGVFGVLELSQRQLLEAISMSQSGSVTVSEQIREENNLLTAIKSHRDQYPVWMFDVGSALRVVPDGVEVYRVALESAPGSEEEMRIVIEGNSFSRASVLDFQRSLDDLDWVKSVDAPLQNLASGQQVKFSFTLERHQVMPSVVKEDGI